MKNQKLFITLSALLLTLFNSDLLAARADRPNVIVIMTDDLDFETVGQLPKVRQLMGAQGLEFENSFVANSLCCPSRTTFLTGRYSHNTQVMSNSYPSGGFRKFEEVGGEKSTIATWLQGAGYSTILIGKYLNGYSLDNDPTHVPPGWTEWFAAKNEGFHKGYNYNIVSKEKDSAAKVIPYGAREEDFFNDVLTERAVKFIRDQGENPFFMYFATSAPHGPAPVAARHAGSFSDVTIRDRLSATTGSLFEADMSDKPLFIRNYKAGRLGNMPDRAEVRLTKLLQKRLGSMLAVEDSLERLLAVLQEQKILDRTYIIFTADNGFHLGEHNLGAGKTSAYEEDIHVPLMIRGPGIEAGQKRQQIVVNTDLAPTIAELAGVAPGHVVDGRSWKSLLDKSAAEDDWRTNFLIEHVQGKGNKGLPAYRAVRTAKYTLVNYHLPGRQVQELYNLQSDRAQLNNLGRSNLPAVQAVKVKLTKQAEALAKCQGKGCWELENAAL